MSATLAGGKFYAADATGSVALLGASFDALMDIGVTALSFGAVRYAQGHKARNGDAAPPPPAEQWVAVLQTMVMLGVGGFIVHRSAVQLITHEMSMRMEETPLAIATIIAALGLEIWRAALIARVARSSGSAALAAAALSFRMDLMTTTVALLGLLTVGTGLQAADPIAAVIIGCVMLYAAARLCLRSAQSLLQNRSRA